MKSFILLSILMGCSVVSMLSCETPHSDRKNTNVEVYITRKDTIEILQTVLLHKPLDSLLNFAFKSKTLKIVKNKIINSDLNLTVNNKPVQYVDVDSTSKKYRDIYNPGFFLKVTVFEKDNNNVRLVLLYQSIGLFGEYILRRDSQKKWHIASFDFFRT